MSEDICLSLVEKPNEENAWYVRVESLGIPDFTVRAGSHGAAGKALADFIYNELDGKEDVVDDDSLLPQ